MTVVEITAPQQRRRALSGAWLMSGATAASGVLTYAFLVLAARTLGPHAYGLVAVLWGAIFIGAIVVYRPLEQTASRTIADRLARGHEVRTVVRALLIVGACAVVFTVLAVVAAWGPITRHAFLGDGRLTALLLAGIVAYGISYIVRGIVGGVRWFGGYGLVLTADGVARLAVAAPLLLVASKQLAGGAMVAAGLAGAVVPLAVGHRRIAGALAPRGGQSFRVGSAFAFAAPAVAIAAADQLLVNGAPLLVILDGGAQASKSAGVVFAATMLVRAPIYVFQGLAASFLPNLTALAAVGDRNRFHDAVVRCSGALLATGVVMVMGAAALGTHAMGLLYGHEYSAGRGSLVLLAVGAALYLAAGTVSQGLLALDRGRAAAVAWGVAAASFVALFLVLPGSELWRASLAFALGMAAGTLLLAAALVWEARSA